MVEEVTRISIAALEMTDAKYMTQITLRPMVKNEERGEKEDNKMNVGVYISG